jgi:hypothetical protein
MTWVALRQHRTEILTVLALLAAMAAYLIPTGLDRLDTFRDSGLEACLNAGQECPDLRDRFVNGYNSLNGIVGWFNLAPAVAGVLLAAPLISDLEQRTYRLAWTQSVTRLHWLTVKLGVAMAGVLVFSVLLTVLMTWWHTPLDRSITLAGDDFGQSYEFEGLMPFSYTFFAFALALAAGMASRRLLAAILAGLVGFISMRLVVMVLLREGLSSDVSFEAPPGGLALNETTRNMQLFWETQAVEAAIFLSLAFVLVAFAAWFVQKGMT